MQLDHNYGSEARVEKVIAELVASRSSESLGTLIYATRLKRVLYVLCITTIYSSGSISVIELQRDFLVPLSDFPL